MKRSGFSLIELMVGHAVGEADDPFVLLLRQRLGGEFLKAVDQGFAEALESIAVLGYGGAFARVQVLANLFRRVDAVIEVGNERGDRALEVDVVFPQRVVRVEQQGLSRSDAKLFVVGLHIWIISCRRHASEVV